MKFLGILFLGFGSGVVAAIGHLVTGAGLLQALIGYITAGVAVTLLLAFFVIWRTWATGRPAADLVLRTAVPGLHD